MLALSSSTTTDSELMFLSSRAISVSLVFSFLLPTKMKVYILTMLIVAVCIDIGSSKPTHTRKKRQLTGTGVSFG